MPFGGWNMPLNYPSGTLEEHRACRNGAVMFDVSHLGTVLVEGPGSLERLQAAFTNDLGKVAPGRAQYTHLLNDEGGVVDDIIVWWLDDERFQVMPNASNTDGVRSAVGGSDVTETRAVIAVQGPDARTRVATVFADAANVKRFRVAELSYQGTPVTVAGTGYTGEDGLEIAIPCAAAEGLWAALESAGVQPAGLGARDTLRLEAALPLHGQELGPDITPLQAGLKWVVAFGKDEFRGKAALEAERDAGVSRKLVGLAIDGRRPPRNGMDVKRDGVSIGSVTSGNFSPILGHGIALALVSPDVSVDDVVQLDQRGSDVAATVVSTPFVKASPSTYSFS